VTTPLDIGFPHGSRAPPPSSSKKANRSRSLPPDLDNTPRGVDRQRLPARCTLGRTAPSDNRPVVTTDDKGAGEVIAQGSKSLGPRQAAFDAEVTAIESALYWFLHNRRDHQALIIHSDSTSAIARASHTGAASNMPSASRSGSTACQTCATVAR